jgi:hypothetical protein
LWSSVGIVVRITIGPGIFRPPAELVLIRASALAGIAVAFGDYLLRTVGVDPVMHDVAARSLSVLAIAFAAGVNVGGADLRATVVGISRAAKFSALVLLVITSFALGAAAVYRLRRRRPDLPRPSRVIGTRSSRRSSSPQSSGSSSMPW